MAEQITEKLRHRGVVSVCVFLYQGRQLAGVEPHAMPSGTQVDFHGRGLTGGDAAHFSPATRAAPLAAPPGAGLLERLVQRSRRSAGQFHDQFELSGVEPCPPAIDAVVQLNAVQLDDDQRLATVRTHGTGSGPTIQGYTKENTGAPVGRLAKAPVLPLHFRGMFVSPTDRTDGRGLAVR